MIEPKPIGGEGTHDALRKILRTRPPAKVLDCPCGEGALAVYLRDMSWDVHCSDIDPGNLRASGFPFQRADLNEALPHRSGEFDVVVCANALHRLFNPGAAIKEFRRVLRPGGTLFLNLNNYSSLDRRLRFLLYGSLDNSLNSMSCQQTSEAPEANLRVPLLLPTVAKLLELHQFRVTGRWVSGVPWSNRLLWPLSAIINGFAAFVPSSSRRRNHLDLTNSTAAFPGGRYLLIEALRG